MRALSRLFVNSRGLLFPKCPSNVLAQLRVLHKKPIPVAWEKPNYGRTKFNFNESLHGETGKASIGGVFRTTTRSSFSAIRNALGGRQALPRSFAALQRGLELIHEKRWKSVWLEGDALTLVEIVKGKTTVKCVEIQRYVTRINLIIQELRTYKVSHIHREVNRPADKFAQLGYQSKVPRIWRTPPDEVLQIFHDDAQGKTVLRK